MKNTDKNYKNCNTLNLKCFPMSEGNTCIAEPIIQ